MTDCLCPPNINIGCDGSYYSVTQPSTQILPDGAVAENPYFDENSDISYYSYQLMANCQRCSPPTYPVDIFGIIICENISPSSILRVDGLLSYLPEFESFPFSIKNYCIPPAKGFNFLQVDVDKKILPGSAAIFRLALSGMYPPASTEGYAFQIIAGSSTVAFKDIPQFRFAGCSTAPSISVNKTCSNTIKDNLSTLDYNISITNNGDTTLYNIDYEDILSYDGNSIILGDITVSPPSIEVDTSIPGTVIFSDNFCNLLEGESIDISYRIPVHSFSSPNTYIFSNVAMASSEDMEGTAECMVDVEVVELATENLCVITEGNQGTFISSIRNLPNSPSTDIVLEGTVEIPKGLVLRFTNFGLCTALLPSGEPVPLNTDISDTIISYSCSSNIPVQTTVPFPIDFTVVSLDVFTSSPLSIINSMNSIFLKSSDEQVLLRAAPLPNIREIRVKSIIMCDPSNKELI